MNETASSLPIARLKPRFTLSWLLWLLPLLALFIVSILLYQAQQQRGIPLTIEFQQGYGIKTGDTLRYRGIEIGQVYRVRLSDDLQKVLVDIYLAKNAASIARQGSRFWIVRPQLDITGASGLETVVGANYISVLPNKEASQPQTHFVGLDMPLSITDLDAGGVEILLQTSGKGMLKRGAPVLYRQVAIGTILNVDLDTDSSAVVVHAYIKPEYTHFIRENARFWKISGMRVSAGWTGVDFQMDSLYSVIAGGIGLAIPSDYGALASTEKRFPLYDEPQEDWLQWTAYIAPDSQHLTNLANYPKPLWATLSWQNKRLAFWRETQQQAWVLPVQDGFLAPKSVLIPPDGVENPVLAIGDLTINLQTITPIIYNGDLAILPYTHNFSAVSLPLSPIINTYPEPINSLVIADATTSPHPIKAERYQKYDDVWLLQDKQAFSPSWLGAPVIATETGELLGILIVTDNLVGVSLLIGNPLIEKDKTTAK
ncbi:mce related protein [Beggiatoa alba B18LD]|uniref:Mce related protein n=1 Tax=Beggiatoa alba B18LD TaxID=395493 RepID=I3CHA5_9GAMM|nr:MlaD family protein [Beggiatoa alba]EIJ42998.1 mce related protein [Beggiatoa alba B18LD]